MAHAPVTRDDPSASRMMAEKSVEVRRISAATGGPCERGLFALRDFQAGEFVVAYDSEVLDRQQFLAKYPAVMVGERVWLSARDFRRDLRVGSGDTHNVQLRKRAADLYGPEARLTGERRGGQVQVELYGFHQANHTLAVADHDLFLDSEVVADNGVRYLLGLGALVNSSDPEFGAAAENTANVEYQVCPPLRQAAVVVRQGCRVRANEEFLASYQPRAVVVLSVEDWRHNRSLCS